MKLPIIAIGLAVFLCRVCNALRSYEKSAALDPGKTLLAWTLTGDAAELALVITDPTIVKANATTLWLGLGIGDPQRYGFLPFVCISKATRGVC
jgi:hypothetical protein